MYLIPDTPPTTIQIRVPRPALGDLVKAFADEPTLYGETLIVEVADEKDSRSREWRELIYDAEENRARYEIQQRLWRIHRGEGTEADARAELQAELLRRRHEQ